MRKMPKKEDLATTKANNKTNINQHGKFQNLALQGLKSGGLNIVANKDHGKTRLMFSFAQELRRLPTCRVIIFDDSESWLYGYSRIEVFTVSEHDILAQELKTVEEFEKYTLANFNFVKLALEKHRSLLFRLKTRKPSKRGFFVRQVVNYLDLNQRIEKEANANHEPNMKIAYFIEEAQDAFNTRSTSRTDCEEFLTVFNEARNNREAFITASQRLNDFARTIRSKQLYIIGKLNSEDINPFLRRIERTHNLDFSNMEPRQWYFEGKTFKSPTFKQVGKPYQINDQIKQLLLKSLPHKKTLKEKLKELFKIRLQEGETEEKPDFEKVEFPEEDDYPDSSDSDLIEFGL
jgi:hypothetical protein